MIIQFVLFHKLPFFLCIVTHDFLSEYESTISFLEELGLAEPLPKCEWRLRFDKIDEVVEQKLSKQVTEEEFKKFMLKVYNDWQNNPDKTAIDYMLEQIFSHYILIPKE